jgi:hypothetical protein
MTRYLSQIRPGPARFPFVFALAAAVLTAASPSPGCAQEDYRSLDAGRPVRVTDAFPIKFMEWEIQFGLGGRWAETQRAASSALALEAGLLRNTSFGIEIVSAFERASGQSTAGVEAVSLHMLYNILRESWGSPAFAVKLDADVPVGGDLGRQDWLVSGELVASRSVADGIRVHANGGYASGAVSDGGDVWLAGVATDLAVGYSGRLLVADVVAEIPTHGGRSRVWLEIGARVQISNTSVIDVGLASRADEWRRHGANLEIVLGFSRSFGIRGLTRVPDLPPPQIH